MPGPHPGVLDWYTVLVGVFTLCVLGAHGALYLILKTTGPVRDRAYRLAGLLWTAAILVGIPTTIATSRIRPSLYASLIAQPWTWALVFGIVGALIGISLR